MNRLEIEEIIKTILCDEILNGIEQIHADDQLSELGIDSISLVELIVIIEETFLIEFDTADLAIDNFLNTNTISTLVEKKILTNLGEKP